MSTLGPSVGWGSPGSWVFPIIEGERSMVGEGFCARTLLSQASGGTSLGESLLLQSPASLALLLAPQDALNPRPCLCWPPPEPHEI